MYQDLCVDSVLIPIAKIASLSGFGFEFLIALGIGLDGIVLQRGPNWMAVVFLHFAVKNFFLVDYLCREKKIVLLFMKNGLSFLICMIFIAHGT